jgi:hypothetical protein
MSNVTQKVNGDTNFKMEGVLIFQLEATCDFYYSFILYLTAAKGT